MHRYLTPPSLRWLSQYSEEGDVIHDKILTPPPPPGGKFGHFEDRIKALETRITYLEVDTPTGVKKRLMSLEHQIDKLRQSVGDHDVSAELHEGTVWVKDIEDLLNHVAKKVDHVMVETDLQNRRLDKVEYQGMQWWKDAERLNGIKEDLKARLNELERAYKELEKKCNDRRAGTTRNSMRIDSLMNRTADLDTIRDAIKAHGQRIKECEGQLLSEGAPRQCLHNTQLQVDVQKHQIEMQADRIRGLEEDRAAWARDAAQAGKLSKLRELEKRLDEFIGHFERKTDGVQFSNQSITGRLNGLEQKIDDLQSLLSYEISRGRQRQDQIDEAFKRLSNFASDVTKLLDPIEKKMDAYRVSLHNTEKKIADLTLEIYGWGTGIKERLKSIETIFLNWKKERPWTR